MDTTARHKPSGAPPDPFRFPSDTDFRFALLIISVAASALVVYRWLYHGSDIGAERYGAAVARCFRGPAPAAGASMEELIADNQRIQACMAAINRETGLWMIAGALVLFAAAGLLYLLYPRWKIHRRGYEPLTQADAPQVFEHLHGLCDRVGLRRPPSFVWNPLDPSVGGLVFGRWGRYYIGLSGGLVTTFTTDRTTFDAVALHELAHLKNGDVDKAYWSLVLWYAFLAFALAPLAVDLLDNTLNEILRVLWRVAGLAALVYLVRGGVLRARELFADARMSQWYGDRAELSAVLGSVLSEPRKWKPRPLAAHPDRETRLVTLTQPARLLRFSAWDAVAAGVAGAIIFASLNSLLGTIFYASQMAMLPPIGASLLVAGVAVGIVGLGIWRQVYLALGQKGARVRAGVLGLAFGVGLALGRPLALQHFVEPFLFERDVVTIIARLGFVAAWSAGTLLALVLFFRWIRAGAAAWLGDSEALEPPRLALMAGLVSGAVVLAAWLGPALWLRGYDATTAEMALAGITALLTVPSVVPVHPLTHISLLAIWGFPLAGAVYSTRRKREAAWDARPPLLVPVLLTAFGAVAAFGLLAAVARAGLHFGLDQATRETDAYKLLLYGGHLVLAFALQAALGVIVTARTGELPVVTALFSAYVSGGLMAAATLVLSLPFGGSPDLQFAWSTFGHMTVGGALVVLPLASVTSVVARRLRAD